MRRGPYTLWLCVEPLGPWRTGMDGARPVPAVANLLRYRQAERLILVCDHWNTHTYASFDRAFPPDEALHRARRPGAYSGCLRLARLLAPQGRTGTERPDAAGRPRAGRCRPRSMRRTPRGLRPTTWPKPASTGCSRPRTPQTSVPYNINMTEYYAEPW